MSSYNLNKWNPPPPPPLTDKSVNVASAEITSMIAPTPSHAFIEGLPIQYYAIQGLLNFSLLAEFTVDIDFSLQPFTYINISNVTTDSSPFIRVNVTNIPLGLVFMINGPTAWNGTTGVIVLEDRDPSGNYLPNAFLDIDARGTSAIPSSYINIMVVRDSNGFVGRAMT